MNDHNGSANVNASKSNPPRFPHWSTVKLYRENGDRKVLIRDKRELALAMDVFRAHSRFPTDVHAWGMQVIDGDTLPSDGSEHTFIHVYSLRIHYRGDDGEVTPIYDFREVKRFADSYMKDRTFPKGVQPWPADIDYDGMDECIKGGGVMGAAFKRAARF